MILKLKGFTLAEVLITLGIIGVVAAITMPTLVANYQNQALSSQLKKVVSELQQAVQKILADDGVSRLSDTKIGEKGGYYLFDNYIKTVKRGCSADDESGDVECFANLYKNIDNQKIRLRNFIPGGIGWSECAVLLNGAVVCLGNPTPPKMFVVMDINGQKGPNVLGRDLFTIVISDNGNIEQMENNAYGLKIEAGCNSNGFDYGYCFEKIRQNGWVMDY